MVSFVIFKMIAIWVSKHQDGGGAGREELRGEPEKAQRFNRRSATSRMARKFPALKDRAKLIPSLRDEGGGAAGEFESARPAGESETHRTAGGGAAGRR